MKASRKGDERLGVEKMTVVDVSDVLLALAECHAYLPCRLKASRCFGMRSASATSVGLRLLLDFADVRVRSEARNASTANVTASVQKPCSCANAISARKRYNFDSMPRVPDMTAHRGKVSKVNKSADRWASLALMSGQPGTGRRSLTPPQPVRKRRSQSSRRR